MKKRKKLETLLPTKLTMTQCKKVSIELEKKIARLSREEEDELKGYLKKRNIAALESTGKLLEAPARLGLIVYWFAKKEINEKEKKV